MGKIRAKTLGDENLEQQEKLEAEKRREAKKTVKADEAPAVNETVEVAEEAPKAEKKPVKPAANGNGRSANYQEKKNLIEKNKLYPLSQALELVEKTHLAKFDESVELHINTTASGVSGHMTLPHGTGKQTRVAILAPAKDPKAADDLLKEIEAGKINFDILVATPDAMPRLAKVARILGPKGLMPNPKNGTVTPKPEDVAKKFEGGQLNFKTEAKAPVMHLMVGKLSFGKEKLAENINAALEAVQMKNIKNVTLKSTMSPAVKLLVK